MPASEVLWRGWGWPRRRTVFVGMAEATRRYCGSALFARLAAGGLQRVRNRLWSYKAVTKLRASRGQKRSGRRAYHVATRPCVSQQYVETKLASDEVQSLPHAHPLPPGDRGEAAQVQDRPTVMNLTPHRNAASVFSTCSARRRLHEILEKSPMPSRAAQAQGAVAASDISKAARRQIQANQGVELKAAAKSSVSITHRARRGVVRGQLGDLPGPLSGARPRPRRIEVLNGHQAARAPHPGVSLATEAQISRRGGRREPFRSAALVGYAGLNSSVSQSGPVRLAGRPHNQTETSTGGLEIAGWRRISARQPLTGAQGFDKGMPGKRHRVRRHGGCEETLPHRVRRRARPGPTTRR